MKKNILSLNFEEAKEFFLKNESYINIDLPPYIKFDSLFSKLSDRLKNKDYLEIKESSPNSLENTNYKLLHNKNGKYDWRPFQLIHPVIYLSLVNQITKYNNWKFIKKRFGKIRAKSSVNCMSLPIISETNKSDKAEQILNWWEQIEQKSLELNLEFNYIYHTDIVDCYGSIYTHSIPWAIHSKEIAKSIKENNAKGKKLIGNIIDRHIRAMSYGQTNGIPQGSVLMDFIAEMVLNYADLLLSRKIPKEKIESNSFSIIRYRDDYRIFVNSPMIAEKIIKILTEVLIDLGLKLHSQKTVNYDNVIEGSIKSDKLAWMMSRRSSATIQKQLLVLHNFSKTYHNSGTLTKELQNIFKKINAQTKDTKKLEWFLKKENLIVLISITVDIAYHNPRTYAISTAILSKLFSLIDDKDEVIKIVKKVIQKFNNIPNTGHMHIWLQRAIIKIENTELEFEEKICKLVNGENIQLWNNTWLYESISDIFVNTPIIDVDLLGSIDEVIEDTEVLLFQYDG